MTSHVYHPREIEQQAQDYWDEEQSFKMSESSEGEKFYCLSMFPYPSGRLHMGHVRNYTIGDVISRYQRMQGKNVLQPMGWDAFGMPAENAAMKNNVPPARWTRENIDYMRTQLKQLGFAYDWQRELATCDPDYYRWEQWLFIQLYKKDLVYKKTAAVNWCPNDMTVLANEQVIDGCCWRCDTAVERKEIPQWFMKITAYADELLTELDNLPDWPEKVRTMQRNWIGRSKGIEVVFGIEGQDTGLKVFTTRPDTLMGVSYVAVAPEHALATEVARDNADIAAFIKECEHAGTSEASIEALEKRGLDLGLKAIHPISGEQVPVYVANFVLIGYGEGAVMAVPAHDQRDWEFAQKYQIPIRVVITPEGYDGDVDALVSDAAHVDKGVLVNSAEFTGLNFRQAFDAIAAYLEKNDRGRVRVNYRLRDWGVSRQRYWGAPIPMINCPDCGVVPVPEDQLPVVLPEEVVIDGEGSPIKKMPAFYQTTCPECGHDAQRETDTFDTFMESSWYYARYASYDQGESMLDQRADYWLPVDQYVGGIEHAILHLLYARFFHKLMRDAGLITSNEPFSRLLTQGMVLKDGSKMSKSRGNTVDPQELVGKYGADTVRLFTMFAAPPEQSLEWNGNAVEGASRFLKRFWKLVTDNDHLDLLAAWKGPGNVPAVDWQNADADCRKWRHEVHCLLQQSNRDFAKYQFNTVVSAGMKLLNLLYDVASARHSGTVGNTYDALLAEGIDILIRMLAPIVPHICHALWGLGGVGGALLDANWPQADPQALLRDNIEIVVQVNGKLRGKINIAAGAEQQQIEDAALGDDNVQRFIKGRQVRKIIVVPNKLVNIVVS
ncbi:MAG: leucine--tRNA ligase [Gammaproteobacteria bacterium]|nr:MAG: leucine--tRNA ligase [Gammaproteobacteria bacterium]